MKKSDALVVSGVAVAILATLLAGPAGAEKATVTQGDLSSFAAGPSDPAHDDITGRVTMIRTAGGTTIVNLHAEGLLPNTTYGSHVHQAACDVGEADGHYQFTPAGPVDAVNEIWPGFTTNAEGIGNGKARNDQRAGASAVSVVIHRPGDNAKVACADLT